MELPGVPPHTPGLEPDLSEPRFNFSNTYARLPESFYARLQPTPTPAPHLICLNLQLAQQLGLNPEALSSPAGVAILAGNKIAAGSEPIALAYAGHQFGHFVPQLGDGRTNLLGEVIALNGSRFDLQLKGSGPTPFSRNGDGRAALGPVLREYLVSEAMATLGLPTTRALAALSTGESVIRETILPGGILVRVASSHLRVGSFQFFAARQDVNALRILADFAIARHYPELGNATHKYLAFLSAVIARQAELVAQWMMLGFIHGVMNTDNMSISGETIDYGPCAFMEAYDPATVFSSIDHAGRYAYGNQPHAALWNLARLAEALLPLLAIEAESENAAVDAANLALSNFESQYHKARLAGLRRKLGLFTEQPQDANLAENLLNLMQASKADFTSTFCLLCDAVDDTDGEHPLRALFTDQDSLTSWLQQWRDRLQAEAISPAQRSESMIHANPLYIPRNHLVAEALDAATAHGDFKPFLHLLNLIYHPFIKRNGQERFATPARPEEVVHKTFCGT